MLTHFLTQRTWAVLRATAHAHQLRFNTHWTKAESQAQLRAHLLEQGGLRRAVRQLSADEQAALQHLRAAGGSLPRHEFTAEYGALRPYRPWHRTLDDQGGNAKPWQKPISITERLWFLGMIDLVRGRIPHLSLAAEVVPYLPPLPQIMAVASSPRPACVGDAPCDSIAGLGVRASDDILTDLATLLGVLGRDPVRPQHGRWLPMTWWRRNAPALMVGGGTVDLPTIRSERHAGRLHFLHYLAEVAGLIALQHDQLLPTVAGWQWLALDETAAWQVLWSAMQQDLQAQERVWDVYRLPSVTPADFAALVTHVTALPADQPHTLRSLMQTLQAPLSRTHAQIALPALRRLLREPLTWLGVVAGVRQQIQRPTQLFIQRDPAHLHLTADRLTITVPLHPPRHAWAQCLAWGELVAPRTLVITPTTLNAALSNGQTLPALWDWLAHLQHAPVDETLSHTLTAWQATITIQEQLVLTVEQPATLRQLCGDWRLRRLLGNPVSSRQITVPPQHLPALQRALQRRGHHLHTQLAPTTQPAVQQAFHETRTATDYLWLAARVYQQLGALLPQTVPLPAEVLVPLTTQIGSARVTVLESHAQSYAAAVQQALSGHLPAPTSIAQTDAAHILATVTAAYEQGQHLTIEYFSPTYGETTIRTIRPLLLYKRNGATYIEAYCERDEAERTFRVDRIRRIVEWVG